MAEEIRGDECGAESRVKGLNEINVDLLQQQHAQKKAQDAHRYKEVQRLEVLDHSVFVRQDKYARTGHVDALNHHAEIAREHTIYVQEHVQHRERNRSAAFRSEPCDEGPSDHHRRVIPMLNEKPDAIKGTEQADPQGKSIKAPAGKDPATKHYSLTALANRMVGSRIRAAASEMVAHHNLQEH